MLEMEGAAYSKPPQISEMFQKFALAFKAKTFELFADDDQNDAVPDAYTLLDSAEDFIPDQKVVVIKPDPTHFVSPPTQLTQALISSLFANISSFEASYLQFQTAHVPLDEKAIESADKALVLILQKLTDLKNSYRNFYKRRRDPGGDLESRVGSGSVLEFRVQENQSKLRALETMVNQLQSEIDNKDDHVLVLKRKLNEIEAQNSSLSKRLGFRNAKLDVLLTIRVFESVLLDSVKLLRTFSKFLIDLLRISGWDMEKAADSVYPDVNYAKQEHSKYAFLSYVCLGMFKGFDLHDFGICDGEEVLCNGNGSGSNKDDYMKQLIEHVSSDPMEVLNNNPTCDFSRFCERRYEQLIHPTMESSILSSLDRNDTLPASWKSLSVLYDAFVRMASSVWLLHKLAFSFDPAVEIFQVERAVDFSMVYMEDVTRKANLRGPVRPKVEFTVVPGFKVGKSIIQSLVYLSGFTE